jgi:hypothetical protein
MKQDTCTTKASQLIGRIESCVMRLTLQNTNVYQDIDACMECFTYACSKMRQGSHNDARIHFRCFAFETKNASNFVIHINDKKQE